MFQPKIRKAGVPPFIKTKYDFQKSRPIEDYLSNKVPMQSDKLKERLLNANMLEPKCAVCGLLFWQQENIPLELDHIDGDHNNNNLKNLQLICPNCHAQTDNYRVKKPDAKSAMDVHGGKKPNR
tara:strand:- start:34 stop:405 length:372 start_codon:yes stop_codon:yes gene_type:complete